jgi:hypothetical protein
VPQIEVSFGIDANGIVHVAAKDLGISRAQSIKVVASSGLSEEELQRMVGVAEAEDGKHLGAGRNWSPWAFLTSPGSTSSLSRPVKVGAGSPSPSRLLGRS